jgi:predicted peptidase
MIESKLVVLLALVAVPFAFQVLGFAADGSAPVPEGVNLDTEFCMVEYEGQMRPYRIFFPSSYIHGQKAPKGEAKEFPLVIVLHPAGGDETSYFQWKGEPARIQVVAEERGYIVAAPALPPLPERKKEEEPEAEGEKPGEGDFVSSYWNRLAEVKIPEMVSALVREIKKQRWIDDSRVYLMGASKGGMSTYLAASREPETFAAICGVVALFPDEAVEGLSKVPVMMFNATRDKHFSIDKAREMVEKLEAAGGEAKLHVVEGGHGGYRNYEAYNLIFDWFDAHQRKAEEKE